VLAQFNDIPRSIDDSVIYTVDKTNSVLNWSKYLLRARILKRDKTLTYQLIIIQMISGFSIGIKPV
jgi:hypothetical protein